MKSLIAILVLTLLASTSAMGQWVSLTGPEGKPVAVTLREDTPSGTVIEFKTPGYYLSSVDIQGKTHSVLSVPKAVTFLEKGYPELPRISKSIMIPDEAKMKFEIVEAEYETTYVAPIAPSKGSLPRKIDPKTVAYTFSDVYKTDTWWPQQIIELSDPFIMRDIRGITVRFNLFRYNAVRGQLIICKRLVVRIFADGIDNINLKTSRKGIITPDMIDTYERFFLNFSQRSAGALGKVSYTGIGETGRMLIIAADDFYNSMIPLRDWRTRKGHRTTLVKCSDIGTTVSAVQTYIQNMYNNQESVLYILLVGEANLSDIPTKSVPSPNVDQGNPYSPKDPTYALLEGGPNDPYPDAYVSRISAENVDQVDNQVMRILKYETIPVSGSWFQKACGIASHQYGDSTRCNLLRDDLLVYGYTSVDKLYDITSPQPITNAINDGRGVVNYIGHGIPTEWGFNDPYIWPLFSVSDVQNLSNTNLLPFIFSVACEVGSFSEVSTCFAEAWLRGGTKDNPKGAIAFFGSSIGQDIVEPTTAQAEAVDLLAADAKITVGGLCFNGVCKMLEQHGIEGVDEAETWHIFGDAASHLWTKTPLSFTSAIVTDNGNSITVNAGIAGSTICVSSGNNGSSFWQRVDNVSSYTFNTSVRPLYITVTKHNYIPYTAVTGGNFTSAETWFGNLHLLGTVAFTGNGSLKLLPGTKVLMDGYHGIGVYDNARLIAEGSAENPIVFTSTTGTTPQSWNRIYLRSSNNSLKYCEVEYSNWGIHAYGYPSSGNIIENCTIQANDQGIRIERSGFKIKNCDIHDNRHNIVTINNPQVDIEGARIYNGGRDGIYSYSGNLVNIYGSVIENNGTGGTSTCNGILAGYNDVINIGRVNSPYWFGYNTIRNNYGSEVYALSGISGIQMMYNSVHDDDGYEIFNVSSSNPTIPTMFCWWGEAPPNYAQFYGNVSIMDELESRPTWEGQTSSGGLSKLVPVPEVTLSPEEQIARLKNLIAENSRSKQADSALMELFSIVRSDYVANQYQQRDDFYSYLSKLYASYSNYQLGRRALQYMIIWKMLAGENKTAIELSLKALDILDNPAQGGVGVLGNLVNLYTYSAQFDNAAEILKEYKNRYKDDLAGIEFLTETLTDKEKMYAQEKALAKGTIPPQSEPVASGMPEEFKLHQAYPNPFNPQTTIVFDLPSAAHVILTIYDLTGREIVRLIDADLPASCQRIIWDGKDRQRQPVASGIYLYALRTSAGFSAVKKMVLVR